MAAPGDAGEPASRSERPASDSAASQGFGDRLARLVEQRQSQLVLGLDPDPARLWPRAVEVGGGVGRMPTPPPTAFVAGDPTEGVAADPTAFVAGDPAEGVAGDAGPIADGAAGPIAGGDADAVAVRAAAAVAAHCRLVIAAAGAECVAAKFQVACFERLGAPGWAALGEAIAHARDAGLLVIADAKRGDIDVSAEAYAQAFFGITTTPFGELRGLGVDALTANPLLGVDALQPLLSGARRSGGGLFVLVRTSNPGAVDLQEMELAIGGSVSERLAVLVDRLGAAGVGESGLSDVGAVVGATAADRLERLRALMPHAVLLLPGVGAQGGRIERLAAAYAPGRGGGLVSASRSLVFAYQRLGGEPADAARREAARLRALTWEISA